MASAVWQRRNEAARARGYRNYYDYRIHRYGVISPKLPAVSGPERMELAGKRGTKPRQLEQVLAHPESVALIVEMPITEHGVWTHMRYVVTFNDAYIKEYIVPIPDSFSLQGWRDDIKDSGVDFIEYTGKVGSARKAA